MATTKLSATLDEGLVAEVRARVGPRGVSAFVNQAVAEKLQHSRVLGLLDRKAEQEGPPTAAGRRAAARELARIFRDR